MTTVVDEVLAHHGIKGMKWGVRRDRGKAAVAKSAPTLSEHASEDFKAAIAARSKPASHLSNKEMQDLINRMNLEQQYTRLLSTPPPAVAKAPPTRKQKTAKFVTNLLVDVGKEQLTRVARAEAGLKVESALLKNNRQDLVERLTNGNGKKKKK